MFFYVIECCLKFIFDILNGCLLKIIVYVYFFVF
jgi:hypothetical protein